MTTHEWRERDEDGELTFHRANYHAARWTFASRPKAEPEWTNYEDQPPLELLESFREVLWNKVQRRRAPEKLIDQIDAMIEELREKM